MSGNILHFVRKTRSGMWAVKKRFVGEWRITGLAGFDAEYVDLCGPAVIKVSPRGIGRMNFGAVEIELDCKMDDLDEQVLRFSFEGADEGDPICGRGYCLTANHQMTGRIFLHCGDEIDFTAGKMAKNESA